MPATEFSFDELLEVMAQRVAAHVLAQLAQGDSVKVKPRLLTVEQGARYLGRTAEALQHMIAAGKIPTVRMDRRVLLDLQDLDRLIEECKMSNIR